ncbi:MAG: hypothetical protein AAGA68_15040 [Pseudomonadota bacterium]
MSTSIRGNLWAPLVLCALCLPMMPWASWAQSTQAPALPANGEARDDPETRAGFRVYFAPLGIWLEPDVFWYRWADEKKAFLWNGSEQPPEGPEVEEGHMVIVERADGPCLLVRKDKRWRKAGTVYGWGERLRAYGGCHSLTLGD